MKKVIICVDENPINRGVCEYGLSLAKAKNCEAVLLYVIKNQNLPAGFFTLAAGGIAMYDEQILEISEKPNEDELNKANQTLSELEKLANGVKIQTKVEFGNLIDILNSYAPNAEIFVMSIKDDEGETAVNKSANVLLGELKKPILFVNRNFGEISSVLVAFDGGEASQKVLTSLKNSGFFTQNLKYFVVNVNDNLDKSNEILAIAKEILRGENAEFFTLQGNISEEIIRFRRANNIDLIATGALSKNAFLSLFMGSVSKEIMKNALVPILVLA